MQRPKEIEPEFNAVAEALPLTAFASSLLESFGRETTQNIFKAFKQMGLPAPEEHKEFMRGSHGMLVVLNDCGLVIRIEKSYHRVNDSPWVLPPIASIDVGEDVAIEICPGVHFEPDERNSKAVQELLLQEGINFWDHDARNMGRIPVKTTRFPEGIPVVVDRPSVRRLSDGIDGVRQALKKDDAARYYEVAEAVENLYAPLRLLFKRCWPDARKMERFWDTCRSYVQQEKLIAGWNEEGAYDVYDEKASYAAGVAKHYEARLKPGRQSLSSTAPAVHQWRIRPV